MIRRSTFGNDDLKHTIFGSTFQEGENSFWRAHRHDYFIGMNVL